ncbi:23129_t:CDS:2, partial [Gigaspora margarita]
MTQRQKEEEKKIKRQNAAYSGPNTRSKTIKDLQENQRLTLENSELKKKIEMFENALVKANVKLFELRSDIAK